MYLERRKIVSILSIAAFSTVVLKGLSFPCSKIIPDPSLPLVLLSLYYAVLKTNNHLFPLDFPLSQNIQLRQNAYNALPLDDFQRVRHQLFNHWLYKTHPLLPKKQIFRHRRACVRSREFDFVAEQRPPQNPVGYHIAAADGQTSGVLFESDIPATATDGVANCTVAESHGRCVTDTIDGVGELVGREPSDFVLAFWVVIVKACHRATGFRQRKILRRAGDDGFVACSGEELGEESTGCRAPP